MNATPQQLYPPGRRPCTHFTGGQVVWMGMKNLTPHQDSIPGLPSV
jgi:hypothetical protein